MPIESMGGVGVYHYDTGPPWGLLDIGVVPYRVQPGFLPIREALNVTQTRYAVLCHGRVGGSNGPEDASQHARQRFRIDRQRTRASAKTLEVSSHVAAICL